MLTTSEREAFQRAIRTLLRPIVRELVAKGIPYPALDRIELPPEAVQRIAERAWVGATLIISDVGMSGEGRYPMDFMILSHTIVRED